MDPSIASCFLGKPCAVSIPGPVPFCHLRHLRKAEHLYHDGDEFHGLFQVVRGSFKTLSSTSAGIEQVLDFYVPGDFMGMDAISGELYPSTAIALQESDVCAISYSALNELCALHSDVQNNVHIAMSREIRRKAEITTLLGYTNVEERVAIFLLDLLDRTARTGGDTDQVPLPMKRHEIASFLGMSGETLSRQFTRLQRLGLIRARINSVQIMHRTALESSRRQWTEARFSWTALLSSGKAPETRRVPGDSVPSPTAEV